jgi:hypothetical protein
VVEAVRHCRAVMGAIKQLQTLDEDEIYVYAKVRRFLQNQDWDWDTCLSANSCTSFTCTSFKR